MALIKYILELLLTTMIFFFVWNSLKRIFFSTFYQPTKPRKAQKNPDISRTKNPDKKLNWDAETVDYEEVQDNQK